jgi:hypothetical protein
MVEEENQDIAPEDTGEGTALSHSKGRRAFRKLRRELSDEELSSPAVQRLLIDDIERLEKENGKLSDYQDSYYEAEKKSAILSEKLKTSVAQEIIFGVCLTIGAALIGLAPSLWSPDKPHGWASIALGVILIIGGIASKVVKR